MHPDGTVIKINDRALEFAGVSRTEILGTPIWEAPWITTADAKEQLRTAVHHATEGRHVSWELEVQGADGTAHVAATFRPVTDNQGTVTEIIGEGRGISTRDDQRRLTCGFNNEGGSPLLVSYTRSVDESMSTALLNAFAALTVDPYEKDETLQANVDTDALDGFAWDTATNLEVKIGIWGFTVVITPDEIQIYGDPSRL
jgi:PAS domain S-box-containing protein